MPTELYALLRGLRPAALRARWEHGIGHGPSTNWRNSAHTRFSSSAANPHCTGQQRTHAARAGLARLGVPTIGTDRLRGIGCGANASPTPDQLCGRCGHGAVAISPTGEVWPCVFARWISLGNILHTDLPEILSAVASPTTVGPSSWPQGGGSCAPNDPLGI
ncbi:hypothetical protein GCM10022267_86220 [Lentzea roselyniae]|uniref:4Fe4S-binding SPASM domain-containing protein n=1 Tax=Lentzea roselyniae TaxID=531940 RepID=A0ABP7CFA9_9PSEU